ncbi:MAG: hypothetical protein UT06_C0051G0004 [Candidatus Woesebacteria bacterium GW2011_GWA1_38_8]|uniref:Uncharacterized protein n=1 Tax=Candidatus Woesebacteria bacterium GW2011_GWA1_38_8 TaxID=1618547 RepID=A0A0G0KR38_9BACT|nr:MAG: hypothetical protein UT06_C0051G0004 [Candidatus Woesebacteria bacterium GW2011_GWA1_38_8]
MIRAKRKGVKMLIITKSERERISKLVGSKILSPYFFSNSKTSGISVDFRVCPFMKRVDGTFTSAKCKGCYSANILNVYPNLAKKVVALPAQDDTELALFEKSCKIVNDLFPSVKKLRFYSLSDFHQGDLPYIEVASKYFVVDIISKILTLPRNMDSLVSLTNMPNVWVSLSFNKDFKANLPRIVKYLKEQAPKNIQLNYTMNYKEENPDDPFFNIFSVLHFKNNYKRLGIEKFEKVTENRTCAVIGPDGQPVAAHGACDHCHNCHISFHKNKAMMEKQ